ncbi:MAG TPA: DoxX family protein, partial [Terriglobales bacterium]|nr:DoxX family protein [Terriglobales bacterium]
MKAIYLLGRFLVGGFFLYNGFNHFQQRKELAQYAAAKGVEQPDAAVLGSGALMAASGLSLMLGIKPALGALGAVTFLAAVSPQMHDFWNVNDAGQRQNEMIHFSKNMALAAAVLAFIGAEME